MNIEREIAISFLISFPRSGANVLQNVFRISSGLDAQSIYGTLNHPDKIVNYKSHAPSREYLYDETQRLLNKDSRNSKKIILVRDPRDVFISFYEYTQHQKKTTIDQDFFIQNYDFFLAAPIDRQFLRKVECTPLKVIEAYKKHINEWIIEGTSPSLELVVSYEQLLTNSKYVFRKIFNFLELHCTLNENALHERVSLYSNEKRERCIINCWKTCYSDYQNIINYVEDSLDSELKTLGYV